MDNFDAIFARLRDELGIKSITSLAKEVGRSQPAISDGKKNNKFQMDWAVALSAKYGLKTEWILTGKGSKYQQHNQQNKQDIPYFLIELATWAREISKDGRLDWLEQQLAVCLPTWQMWREKKKAETAPAETDQVA